MSWEGTRIKYARKEKKMTQKELAEILDIPIRTIQDWETGKRTPPSYVAKLIIFRLKYLGI